MAGDGRVAGLAGQGGARVVAGPLLEVGDVDPLDTILSTPILGMRICATAVPSSGGGGGGATSVVGGVVDVGVEGAVVVVVEDSSSVSANSSSRRFCACASRIPVPHSW